MSAEARNLRRFWTTSEHQTQFVARGLIESKIWFICGPLPDGGSCFRTLDQPEIVIRITSLMLFAD